MVDITETEKLQLAQGMTSEAKIKELSKEDGMAYSIIKMMLLLLSGLEENPGPGTVRTNLEVMQWLKEKQNVKDYMLSSEAELFFGKHVGCFTTFIRWKLKFLTEEKKVRRKVCEEIMKERGGLLGKQYYDNPPRHFFPKDRESVVSVLDDGEICCNICKITRASTEQIEEHIQTIHKTELKKYFQKEACDAVTCDERFKAWLNSETIIDVDENKDPTKHKSTEVQKKLNNLESKVRVLEANEKVLLKSAKEKEDTITLVRERSLGNIFDTKREVLSKNTKGEVRRTVISEQIAFVTKKRKSTDCNISDDLVSKKVKGNLERWQADVLRNTLNHLADESHDSKVKLISKVIDREGSEFAASILRNSKSIQNNLKLTVEDTAALIAACGGNDNTFTKIRTATNKQLGFNNLASQRKVKLLRNRISTIDRDDWLESKEMLYKLKQGQNAKKQTETCVMKVKNLKAYIQKFVISESDNLTHLQDGDKLKICYDADAGGGRFIAEFAILNGKDQSITLHPFLLFEGSDVRENLEVVFSSFTMQIKSMEGEKLQVNKKSFVLEQFGVFDLCALNNLIGKQNHSSTFPDAWTNVTRDHLQNHKHKNHTPSSCDSINFLSLKDYDKNLTHHTVHSGFLILRSLII